MQILSFSKPGNIESVTYCFLKELNVKFNFKSLNNNLKDHHEYPSLLAMSDVLTAWSISNQAYKILPEDYNVKDLEFPFVAHSKQDGGRYVLVHHIENQEVTLSDERRKRYKISEKDFLNYWDGIVLHAKANNESGEKRFCSKQIEYALRSLSIPFLIFIMVCISLLTLTKQAFSWGIIFLFLLKFSGIAVSILLLIQSINSNNSIIKNLCGLGGKNDCNSILKSEAAKVTSWLSWSEVGFFYFSGSFLFLLIGPKNINFISWLNVFALPYTLYSFSYQYRNKNWCILCCAVQALLIFEFLCFYAISSESYLSGKIYNIPSISFPIVYLAIISFLTPLAIWGFLKPFFSATVKLAPLTTQLNKFKYNTELFTQALINQPKYGINKELAPVVLGNPDGDHVITIVSNPLCGPCSKAHNIIDELLETRNDVRVNIIFSTRAKDDEQTKIVKHFLALSAKNNKPLLERAMKEWFNAKSKNYENWAKKHSTYLNPAIDQLVEAHASWIKIAEIKSTPTILLNGYILPEPYKIEDLKHLLS